VDQLTYVALPLLFALLIAAAVQLDLRDAPSLLRTKPMVLLGQWSYALYLVHATVIYFLIETVGVRPFGDINVVWLLGVTAVSVAASAVLYMAFEHPVEQRLRDLQKRWLARREARVPEAEMAGSPGA
jgi:peptidoglycan/LPS O-acetylase OafA/YrhL